MNFSFLNSAVLWAIPLSLLPVALHLLFRRPPKIVPFSDLRFLVKIYERYRPRRKLHEWLILLLRVLALASLFMFFSRPVFHWGGHAGERDSLAMVLLVDASYSMRAEESGRSHWDRAVHLAQAALQLLKESDRSALVVFSDGVDFFSGFLTNEHGDLAKKLKSLQPTYRTTNVLPALQAAYRLLSNSGASNKVILLISDGAKHGWNSEQNRQPLVSEFDPNVRILTVHLPRLTNNVSVQNVRLIADLYSGLMKIEVELKNWAPDSEPGVPVYLDIYADEKEPAGSLKPTRHSETAVTLNAGETKTVLLTAPLFEKGRYTGEVGVRKDSLPADDTVFFAQNAPAKIKILCVEEPSGIAALSGESYFLRQALLAPPSPFEIRTISLPEIKKVSLGSFDSVILVNPGELDELDAQSLRQYLKKGGSLWVTLGERAGLNRLNSISDLLPCSFQEVRETSAFSIFPAPELEDEEFGHFKDAYEWSKVKVNKMVRPEIKENGEAWILFSDGNPFLIFSADRKIAVWTSSIDRSWNNLPSKPVFVPLARFVATKISAGHSEAVPLGGSVAESAGLRVGESLTRKVMPRTRKDGARLISSVGENIPVRLLQGYVISAPLEKPGLHTLVLPDGEKDWTHKLAVNVETEKGESDTTAATEQDLKTVLPGASWVPISADEHFPAELLAALRGKELSRMFLVFAGVSLLGELFLSSRRK